MLIAIFAVVVQSIAQKTCVIASAEDHVPIREALIHTDNNHWARTDYRGYFTMRYAFDSATVSKPGYVKTAIYLKNLPDTVFMLPDAKQLGEVEVWGKNGEHIREMEDNIKKKVNSIPTSPTGIGFDAFGWMDKQGRRDRRHLKEAKKIFQQMDRKDPIVEAYEKASGRKYGKTTEYEKNLEKQDSIDAKKKKPLSFQKIANGAVNAALAVGKIAYDLKKDDLTEPEIIRKDRQAQDLDEKITKKRNPVVEIESSMSITK